MTLLEELTSYDENDRGGIRDRIIAEQDNPLVEDAVLRRQRIAPVAKKVTRGRDGVWTVLPRTKDDDHNEAATYLSELVYVPSFVYRRGLKEDFKQDSLSEHSPLKGLKGALYGMSGGAVGGAINYGVDLITPPFDFAVAGLGLSTITGLSIGVTVQHHELRAVRRDAERLDAYISEYIHS